MTNFGDRSKIVQDKQEYLWSRNEMRLENRSLVKIHGYLHEVHKGPLYNPLYFCVKFLILLSQYN